MSLCSAVATVLAFVSVAYAQSPFVGTWKMNRDKTQWVRDTVLAAPAAVA